MVCRIFTSTVKNSQHFGRGVEFTTTSYIRPWCEVCIMVFISNLFIFTEAVTTMHMTIRKHWQKNNCYATSGGQQGPLTQHLLLPSKLSRKYTRRKFKLKLQKLLRHCTKLQVPIGLIAKHSFNTVERVH